MQGDLFPEMNDLTAILSAGEGGAPSRPLPAADPFMEKVLEEGMTDMDEDLPGIHIAGNNSRIKVIADPSRDQPRERARLRSRMGPPPQNFEPEARMTAREYMGQPQMLAAAPPSFPGYAAAPSPYMGAQVIVHAVDFNRGMLLTSHGSIPMSPETVSKIMQLSIATMREFFAESVNATMQAYNLGGKRRAKPKRKRNKKV